MLSEAEITKELRRAVQSFDYMSYQDQRALIDTRLKELKAKEQPASQTIIYHEESDAAPLPALPGPDVMSEGELRIALRNTLLDSMATAAALKFAQSLTTKAADRVAECRRALSVFDDLASRLAEHEVTQLTNGTEQDLPHSLQEALRDKGIAADRLERAIAAQRQLQAAEVQAQKKHAKMARMTLYFSNSVACSVARSLVAELVEVEAEANRLRALVSGLQLAGHNVPHDITNPLFAPRADIRASDSDKDAWTNLLLALRTNADASLDNF